MLKLDVVMEVEVGRGYPTPGYVSREEFVYRYVVQSVTVVPAIGEAY